MEKIKQRAITYSLLSHIRERGYLAEGPLDVFVPLIKKTLSDLNHRGIFSGKSIYEIKLYSDEQYGVDFPIPVLRKILKKISQQINTENQEKLLLHQDDSFQILNYTFTEFDNTLEIQLTEIENLEKLFLNFCHTCQKPVAENTSILAFIEKNKLSLSKYLANSQDKNHQDFSNEAAFVDYFKKFPSVYDLIKRIYLGSILASYLEYKTEEIKTNIELLFDTNFILGLLDLNTPESTHTCNKIIEIANRQGYILRVLNDTIIETISLLKAKAFNFDTSFLTKKIYPEDIYNACERRNLKQTDIERIADNLNILLTKQNIMIVSDTTKFRNVAKFSKEFEIFKKYRNSTASALHDATAIHYVRLKRGRKITDFENVNCWFINNSINREKYENTEIETIRGDHQPEMIKADDFLNILWLSNPQINTEIGSNDISEIGLSTLISITLSESLPKASIIKELDDNIQKYSKDGAITDNDVIRIATRIATKQLTDIEYLNKLAKQSKEAFVKRLNEEAKKQKEEEDQRIENMNKTLEAFNKSAADLKKLKEDLEKKALNLDEKVQRLEEEKSDKDAKIQTLQDELQAGKFKLNKLENEKRTTQREEFIQNKIKKWRRRSIYELVVFISILLGGILWMLWSNNWSLSQMISKYKDLSANIIVSTIISIFGIIFSSITLNTLFSKYRDYSNIEAYIRTIKIPEELQNIEIK